MAQIPDWDDPRKVEEQTVSYFLQGLPTLWTLIQSEKKRIVLAILFLVVVSVLDLAIPLLFRELLDSLPRIREEGFSQTIFAIIVLMFGVRIFALAIRRFLQEPIFLKAIIGLENHWPRLAQEKLLALSIDYHERENTGKKIAKVNKGVEKMVGMLADMFWQFLPAVLYLGINIPIILWMDWRLGLFFALPLIPYIWINLQSYKKFYPYWMEWEENKEKAVGLFCQSIICIRSVQSFVREQREEERHGRVRHRMRDLDVWVCIRLQRYFFAMEAILGICFLSTILAGLYFIYRGWSTIGTVTYVFVTGNTALQGLWGIIQVYTRMLRHLVAAERMKILLEEPVEVSNQAPGIIPEDKGGLLEYRSVSHTYPGKIEAAISNFNLSIEPGEMLALVGKSGSGKSTLVSLLARMKDPTKGHITIDGHDIRQTDRDWYRGRFAVVPQEIDIFEGTIRYNIALAHPEASEAWMMQAVEAACLGEVIEDRGRFPDGLETDVGERGVQLSGGEKQRVGIARAYVALLAGANVLILDEATSSLDSQSEATVQSFIEQLRKEREVTIVAVAHRLSTIKQADRICVLENGEIVEIGDHARLIRRNGLYSRLVELQDMHVVRE